jgi:hypothetical protein
MRPHAGIKRRAGPAHHRRLDRLAHEARLHHPADRNLRHHAAALRQHLDQPHPRQADQRLARRLPRHAVAERDIGLRQLGAGP